MRQTRAQHKDIESLMERRSLCCPCVSVCELFIRVLIISFLISRCLRVRSAAVSRAGRCCAPWRPVLRPSAWTRSTSRISAVPSARLVSGEGAVSFWATLCSLTSSLLAVAAECQMLLAQRHLNGKREGGVPQCSDEAKPAACCSLQC